MKGIDIVKFTTEMIWNDLDKQERWGLIESLEKDIDSFDPNDDETIEATDYLKELKTRFYAIYN